MSVTGGKTSPAGTDVARLAADVELLETVLEVHGTLDVGSQTKILLSRAAEWAGAWCGFGFVPSEEAGMIVPAIRDVRASRPVGGLRPAEAAAVALWLGEPANGVTAFAGLGPFAGLAEAWPGPGPHTSLAVGIRGEGPAPVAVLLLLLDGEPGADVVERLGRLVAESWPAVRNAEQVRRVRELVIRDDTAQCFNRRHFESALPEELSRAGRYHAALSLIFLDLDNLKEVNNKHGHAAGSRMLYEVSQRIRGKIRRFDKLFRFGGDEFCIVLPETQWHGALEVAERVRDAIARRPFLEQEHGPAGVRMTASMGIASFPLHARSQKELIEQADRAMQRIKGGTKNSIGIAEIVGEGHGD
jgi:diguanylate cyclase (GGDEF)-like protein